MSTSRYYAAFDDDHAARDAALGCRASGLEVLDVFGPYPIHGIDEALGLRPSRLTWACFWFGATGLAAALLLQYWTSATDWPLNVGGKPFESLPAFIPVAFEMTVLFAGLGTVAAFLWRARLFPGRRTSVPDPRVTDDRFVVVVHDRGHSGFGSRIDELWRRHGATRSWEETVS